MSLAHGIWSSGRAPSDATDRRSQMLVAAWFWIAIVVGLLLLPAAVQGRWAFALLAIVLAAPAIGAVVVASRS
jgi:hypothetical protein